MNLLKWLAFAAMLFGCFYVIQPHNTMKSGDADSLSRALRLEKVVAYYTSLDVGEHRDYLTELAEQKDFEALQAIYNSETDFGDLAAEEVVRNLDSTAAVKFCTQFPRGSMNWRAAFLGLKYHPKPFIINYVKEAIHDSKPIVRYCCYTLCRLQHWNDLIENARRDVDNKSYLGLPNPDREIVLGDSAQMYLDSCAGIPPRAVLPAVVIPGPDE